MQNRCVAILLMGGSGERFASPIPKQFALVDEKPLFLHAAEVLSAAIDEVIYVVREEDEALVRKTLAAHDLLRPNTAFVFGGATRQESVKNVVLSLKDRDPDTIVVIHDASRPWVLKEDVEKTVKAASEKGAAILAIPTADSICVSEDGKEANRYLDRKTIYRVQTPQAFRLSLLLDAEKKAKKDYTDEGSLVLDTMGIAPAIVEGRPENRKITTKADLLGE